MIRKLLVANRGEIAVRVMRAAREMGIRTVAIYSEADRESSHVLMADEAVFVGPSEPSGSYLDLEKVIRAAVTTGAEALHPGYGFMSESAETSQTCKENGIRFIGPSARAMRQLGSKIAAKELAVRLEVPIVPGLFDPSATVDELRAAAEEIGYPIMLKASAGGGGRGMRAVWDRAMFLTEIETAAEEAMKAFGDRTMMVEKLIERPCHVEVQILADGFGNVATLYERECSIQRRHQKLIEEAPSPVISRSSSSLWQAMAESARRLILESGYEGAGTVEFIVDEATGNYYFLEVNARIQVEHPVTEAITGIDLVQWQIRIAQGEELNIDPALLADERRALQGHSIEVRVIAEDPARDFLPSIGKIVGWKLPTGPGIRVDTGYRRGAEISRFYDSLIAKVIVHAETRELAIQRLVNALMEFHVLGVHTNISFLLEILAHPSFVEGRYDTGFLSREFTNWTPGAVPSEMGEIIAAAKKSAKSSHGNFDEVASYETAWSKSDNFRNTRSR